MSRTPALWLENSLYFLSELSIYLVSLTKNLLDPTTNSLVRLINTPSLRKKISALLELKQPLNIIGKSFWFSLQSLPQIYPLLFIFPATPFGSFDCLWFNLIGVFSLLMLLSTPFPLKQRKKLPFSCIRPYTGFPSHLKENPNCPLRPKVSQITYPLSIHSASVLPSSTQLNKFQECLSFVSWTFSLPGSLSSLSHGKIRLFH